MQQVGTPLTDALRRDFTINSLFYNLNTGEIEDYTERGVADIFSRIIRTPLEPLVTFKDDPLRVLRCFRFKSRFDFSIHEDIYNSLGN
jgi:tRNA nucleotidyltransferase (CCA-adding enzyme)